MSPGRSVLGAELSTVELPLNLSDLDSESAFSTSLPVATCPADGEPESRAGPGGGAAALGPGSAVVARVAPSQWQPRSGPG